MTKKLTTTLLVLWMTAWSGSASALLDFEVVDWGANFVAFTVSGDFTGYSAPPTSSTIFSIVYEGDLWAGPNTSTSNAWIPGSGPFTRIQVVNAGNTLFFDGKAFSFIQYADILPNGDLVGNSPSSPIIIRFDRRLNTSATNPRFNFVWGGGAIENTLLDSWPDAVSMPALTLDKSADVTTYSAINDVINYSYRVTSTGDAPVAGPITVADDQVTVLCPAVDTVGNNDDNLDPAEVLICSASYTVVQADIDATTITNRATASGDGGNTVSNEDIVTVTYAPPANFTVVATVAAGNGTVSCDPASVPAGGSSTCTAMPDAGWQVSGWTGACAAAGTGTACTLDNIQADQSSTVSFEAISYSVVATVAAGNGTVSCDPASVPAGGSSTCTAMPDAGWQVSGWTGACAAAGTSTACTLDNIQAGVTVTVNFEMRVVVPIREVTPVPALSRWGLALLGLLLAGAFALRRRW